MIKVVNKYGFGGIGMKDFKRVNYNLYKGGKLVSSDFCYMYQLEGTREVYKRNGYILEVV